MSSRGGQNQHGETHLERGFTATRGAVVSMRDQNFYGYGSRSDQRKSLLELLRFPEIRSRESAIDCEHDETCTWLLETPEYASWRATECSDWRNRLLWIKGKVGAGKSTMMKFAVKRTRRKLKNELVLPHFFNARGNAIEHSTEGMYRTLLYWLLQKLPKTPLEELESQYQHHDEHTPWPIPELVEILEAALEALADRSVTFYIDALDECPQNEIRDMLKVFRKIVRAGWTSRQQVRVCFASRPYPAITFLDATFLDFSEQESQLKDMRRYINDELQIGMTPLAEDIRRDVLKKAEGSFMWLTLVVRLLNIDSDGGHVDKLRQRLHDVPSGLSKLYSHILERYPDNHEALLACCQWLIFCKNPYNNRHSPAFKVHQLWWATRQKIDRDENHTRRLYNTISDEEMKRFVVEISKGLVEFRNNANGDCRPQFLHESVREFILSPNDLWQLCGAQDHETFEALSQEALRDVCLAVSESERPTLQTFVEQYGHDVPGREIRSMWGPTNKGKMNHPLAIYAAMSIMHHAEQAQELGLDQTAFLDDLNKRCGPCFLELYGMNYLPHGDVWILRGVGGYVFNYGCVNIIQKTQLPLAQRAWSQGQPFGLIHDDGQTPIIIAALRDGSGRGLNALIRIYLRLRPRTSSLQNILEFLADTWTSKLSQTKLRQQGPHPPLLYAATRYPNLGSFLLLGLVTDEAVDTRVDYINSLFSFKSSGRSGVQEADTWLYYFKCFLQIFYSFLDKRIVSLAINFGSREILQWVEVALIEVEIALMEIQDIENVNGTSCISTLADIKSLVSGRQGNP